MSKIRKAVAAFVGSLLALPFSAWIMGEEPFSGRALAVALMQAVIVADGVYLAPANETDVPA